MKKPLIFQAACVRAFFVKKKREEREGTGQREERRRKEEGKHERDSAARGSAGTSIVLACRTHVMTASF